MELGNLMFNTNKNQIYECPEWFVALLRELDRKMSIVYWNNRTDFQREHCIGYESPFDNTAETFKNDVFEVQPYNWDDEVEQQYNFKCDDVEISWYKYLGRDTTINDNFEEKYLIEIFNKCIKSLEENQNAIL